MGSIPVCFSKICILSRKYNIPSVFHQFLVCKSCNGLLFLKAFSAYVSRSFSDFNGDKDQLLTPVLWGVVAAVLMLS